MKKIALFLLLASITFYSYGQAPALFNYQGVARNAVGNVLVNKTITLRLSIHDGSTGGPIVYSETRSVVTNPFGLFNVQVGSPGATTVTGTIPGMNWAAGSKFIQVEIDPNGGASFFNIGTAQLASVPYAWFTSLSADLVLPFNKTQSDAGTLFKITNSGTGAGSTSLEGLTNSTANNTSAIIGTVTSTSPGGFSAGLRGINNGTGGQGIGVWGSQNGSGWGVYGQSPAGIGVFGASTAGNGVAGSSTAGAGIYGISNTGRAGFFENTNAANNTPTLFSTTNGNGWAAEFVSTNATSKALLTLGGLRFANINEGLNRILTSDAAGNATWQPLNLDGAWKIIGNTGTIDGTNFIGTLDNVPFNVRVNNNKAGRVDNVLRNAFWGYQAGNAMTTGHNNTAMGTEALFSNLTGRNNIAIGSRASYNSTTASFTVAVGDSALFNNTADQNTAVGSNSLYLNTTGTYNTAIGSLSLRSNGTGSANTGLGETALYNNTTGNGNTAVGSSTTFNNTSGSFNTAMGYNSLFFNSSGHSNVAVGMRSLYRNETGSNIVAIGDSALLNNLANRSVAVGSKALYSN
ncbi:MAG TPA: hypothetical protein VGO58_20485, partial [Chitinophagaceae bacterium]|nr:hypothetical protein [Chitinophagaceae bacterium]